MDEKLSRFDQVRIVILVVAATVVGALIALQGLQVTQGNKRNEPRLSPEHSTVTDSLRQELHLKDLELNADAERLKALEAELIQVRQDLTAAQAELESVKSLESQLVKAHDEVRTLRVKLEDAATTYPSFYYYWIVRGHTRENCKAQGMEALRKFGASEMDASPVNFVYGHSGPYTLTVLCLNEVNLIGISAMGPKLERVNQIASWLYQFIHSNA